MSNAISPFSFHSFDFPTHVNSLIIIQALAQRILALSESDSDDQQDNADRWFLSSASLNEAASQADDDDDFAF